MIRPFERLAVLTAILLLGLALRLAPWGHNRFLEDEALYATWGLQVATGADPMLDQEPVDKPPLHPYTLALSFILLGQNETAARLPSLLASMVGIALVYALGQDLFGSVAVGLLAALLLALSPFDILFASTAFTDPLRTALVLAAILTAAKERLFAAGLLSGLAAATKQQGLLFLPLTVAIGLLSAPQHRPISRVRSLLSRLWSHPWLHFGLGFALVAAGVLGWDAARLQRPGFFEQGLISYGGLGPAQPQALGERAGAWLRLAGDFWVSPWFNALLLGAWVLWAGVSRVRKLGIQPPSKVDLAFGAVIACFLVLHWLLGFQVWDRYLLGLVPLAALLAARAFVALGKAIRPAPWRRLYVAGLSLALVASRVGPLTKAARSELPLGGDHGAYDGIDALAAHVRSQVPPGAVLYHYWLGYHYRFYLYGAPLRLHWYPDLADLAHDAYVYRREPRYIAFPSWRDSSPEMEALASAGIRLVPVMETSRRDGSTSFRLYRMAGP
jgi:4-amino-4-deoxy-L-arabinose transferase-like glycosyltransferase